MIELSRLPHDFIIPKIRNNFRRQFLNPDNIYSYSPELSMDIYDKKHTVKALHMPEYRPAGETMKRTEEYCRNASNQCLLSGDASQVHLVNITDNNISIFVKQNEIRFDQK